jgi:hypothetical protein
MAIGAKSGPIEEFGTVLRESRAANQKTLFLLPKNLTRAVKAS